jgi:hypothetical protein
MASFDARAAAGMRKSDPPVRPRPSSNRPPTPMPRRAVVAVNPTPNSSLAPRPDPKRPAPAPAPPAPAEKPPEKRVTTYQRLPKVTLPDDEKK